MYLRLSTIEYSLMDLFEELTSERLREWRAVVGLTQAQAAKLFGVARATFIGWENGGAIPPAAGSVCAMAYRQWKKRDLFGFVTLVFSDGPVSQSAFGTLKTPNMHRELYRTNFDAINRAAELLTTQSASTVFIVDEACDVVWNVNELRKEALKRALSQPRVPVITLQEAKQYRKYNSILEVEINSVADKLGHIDIQFHLASPTGDEDDDFEIELPTTQPGAVKRDRVEDVVQDAARSKGAKYILMQDGRLV